MKKEKKQNLGNNSEPNKKQNDGFALRLAFAILFAIIATTMCVMVFVSNAEGGAPINIFVIEGAVFAVLAIIQFVAAFAGKKHKWANVLSIIIGLISVMCLVGLLGIIGGIQGNKALDAEQNDDEAYGRNDGNAREMGAPRSTNTKKWSNFPVDYENKPAVSQFLDFDNTENIFLENERGEKYEFHQIYITIYNDTLYALAETVGFEQGDELVLFRLDYESDMYYIEEDEAVCNVILDEFNRAVEEQRQSERGQEGQTHIKQSEFKLDLYDANIDEGTWKEFKKSASQEELAIIAIGAKYRIAHGRIINMVYALGIILSIVLLFPTGFFSAIGYVVFAFLATKAIRYEDTFSQVYRKLTKENKDFVDSYYNSNTWLTIADLLIKLAVLWLTLPYQAILMIIGMIAPNFVISKNGILVSIPKGYDVGDLGAVGSYYASFSFIDESLDSMERSARREETATYVDEYGNTTDLSETAQVGVYTDKYGTQRYVSDDGGKTVRKDD